MAATKPRVIVSSAYGGGMPLAFVQEGYHLVAIQETGKLAQTLLRQRFPETPVGDLHAELQISLFKAEVVAGTYISGRTEGYWRQTERIVAALRPPWVVFQWPISVLRFRDGEAFTQILSELHDRGYTVAWRGLDSQYFGVPQRHTTLYVVGSYGNADAVGVLFEPDIGYPQCPRKTQVLPALPLRRRMDTLGAAWFYGAVVVSDGKIRTLMPVEYERAQGLPDGWTDVKGITENERIDLIMRSATVPVIGWIARRILTCLG